MKERFLNIFLFLISLLFIISGITLMFFNNLDFLKLLIANAASTFNQNIGTAKIFIAIFGSLVFGWGIILFLMTIYTVMNLNTKKIYGFIFWGFTLWGLSLAAVCFINNCKFLLIMTLVLYLFIFIPFLLSIPLSSKDTAELEELPSGKFKELS